MLLLVWFSWDLRAATLISVVQADHCSTDRNGTLMLGSIIVRHKPELRLERAALPGVNFAGSYR